jgi:hypothetical protein
VRAPRDRRLADLPDEAETTYRMTSRSLCVILCDSTPPTNALRVLERDVRDESPTTRAARIPANDARLCQTCDLERRYERGGSSPPRRLEARCSIQLSYRRVL